MIPFFNFSLITCFVPNLRPIWPESHRLLIICQVDVTPFLKMEVNLGFIVKYKPNKKNIYEKFILINCVCEIKRLSLVKQV